LCHLDTMLCTTSHTLCHLDTLLCTTVDKLCHLDTMLCTTSHTLCHLDTVLCTTIDALCHLDTILCTTSDTLCHLDTILCTSNTLCHLDTMLCRTSAIWIQYCAQPVPSGYNAAAVNYNNCMLWQCELSALSQFPRMRFKNPPVYDFVFQIVFFSLNLFVKSLHVA
jgi:hypothetical protein